MPLKISQKTEDLKEEPKRGNSSSGNGKGSKTPPPSIEGLLLGNEKLFQRIPFVAATKSEAYNELLKAKYPPLNASTPNGKKSPSKSSENASSPLPKKGTPNKFEEEDLEMPRYKVHSLDETELQQLCSWKVTRKAGCGLGNMGNTCFLNAVMQCLTHTPPLAQYCLTQRHSKQCGMRGFCAFCSLEKHIAKSFSSAHSIIPRDFTSNLKSFGKELRFGRQEDSHEFMKGLTEALQKSCLAGVDRKSFPRAEETTIIHQIFGGYLRSQILCSVCGYKSNTFDPFSDLCLEIKGVDSLVKALQKFTSPETLDKENKYNCPRCKKRVVVTKRFTIRNPPKVLVIGLKRFQFNFFRMDKINRPIQFPENLDLKPFLSNPEPCNYKLYGVLVHAGASLRSGHYFSFIRGANNFWYRMDDSSISQVSWNNVEQQKAYMLFYIRTPSSAPSPSPASLPRSPSVLRSLIASPSPNSPLSEMASAKKRKHTETSQKDQGKISSLFPTQKETPKKAEKETEGTEGEKKEGRRRKKQKLDEKQTEKKEGTTENAKEKEISEPTVTEPQLEGSQTPKMTSNSNCQVTPILSSKNGKRKGDLEHSHNESVKVRKITEYFTKVEESPSESFHVEPPSPFPFEHSSSGNESPLTVKLREKEKEEKRKKKEEKKDEKNTLKENGEVENTEKSSEKKDEKKMKEKKEQKPQKILGGEILKHILASSRVSPWEGEGGKGEVEESLNLLEPSLLSLSQSSSSWDEEYDKGRTKKVKPKKTFDNRSNPFQTASRHKAFRRRS